jgi:hypothetical protein
VDAATFGDRGWHPCYHCGASGVVTRAELLERRRRELVLHREDRIWRRQRAEDERRRRESFWGRLAWDALLKVGQFDDTIPF